MSAGSSAPRRRPPRAHARTLGRAAGVCVLLLATVLIAAPIVWAVSTSLRTPATSFVQPPTWIPTHPVWGNYSAVFRSVPLLTFLLNSVVVTGLIVVAQLITSTMSGYAFAMVRFRGRGPLFAVVLATLMVPVQTTIIPVYLLVSKLHLVNTRTALVLPVVGGAFGTFLMRQYFLQMPKELGEAARVDGASHLRVFTQIYARMALAPMTTLAVLNFSGYWNEFFRPLIFLQDSSKYTLPLGLVALHGNFGTGSVSVVLAGIVLALIPSVAVFALAQRYFVEGVTVGAFR